MAVLAQPNLRLIVVVPEYPSIFLWPFKIHQETLIKRLTRAAPERFAIYHLQNPNPSHNDDQIYVHSKLMIVDDTWAEIGSMNCNRRSMTHDAEVSVAVVDSTIEEGASKFARNLRLRLWAEHLNLDPSDASIGVPLQGFHQWKTRAGKVT